MTAPATTAGLGLIEEVQKALEQKNQVYSLMNSTFGRLENAVVPSDLDSKLSTVFAETVAGAIGGLASRGLARAFQDKKRDSTAAKAANTGAYFGVRALAKTAFWLFGFPRPLAIIAAPALGYFASAVVKYGARAVGTRKSKMGLLEKDLKLAAMEELKPRKRVALEVAGDVCKWYVYETVMDTWMIHTAPLPEVERAAAYFAAGLFAALCGHIVSNPRAATSPEYWTALGVWGPRGSGKATLEGGILFLCYEESLVIFEAVLPQDIGMRNYWFKQKLDELGKETEGFLDIFFEGT